MEKMNKRYAITMEINGIVGEEYTELNNDERFNRKNFINHVSELRNLPKEVIKVLSVTRIH